MRGDLEMGATGTVTHVDGTQIYAFGHPFLNLGPMSMPMTRAQVLTVIPSLDSSMKIATMGPVIGRMTQDRSTAVGGVLGSGPSELAVNLTLESQGSAPRRLQFTVLHDQALTPLFAYVAILNSLITHQRQSGATTIAASGSVTFDGLGVLPIDDMFSGDQAITLAAASAMTPIGACTTPSARRCPVARHDASRVGAGGLLDHRARLARHHAAHSWRHARCTCCCDISAAARRSSRFPW